MTLLTSTGPAVDLRRTRQVEQPVDDLGGAERLALDLLEHLRLRIVGLGALHQHLHEARDAGERRVHFVRHAGGQQADGGHLLGDLELLFELHARGNVLDDHDRSRDRVGHVPERRRRDVHEQAPRRRVPRRQRDAVERRAVGRLAPARAKDLEEARIEDLAPAAGPRPPRAGRRTALRGAGSSGRRGRRDRRRPDRR